MERGPKIATKTNFSSPISRGRENIGISMTISAPKTEKFRSLQTGNTLRFGEFQPSPLPKAEKRSVTRFSFENTLPFVAPSLDITPVKKVKSKPEFKFPKVSEFPKQPEIILVKPPEQIFRWPKVDFVSSQETKLDKKKEPEILSSQPEVTLKIEQIRKTLKALTEQPVVPPKKIENIKTQQSSEVIIQPQPVEKSSDPFLSLPPNKEVEDKTVGQQTKLLLQKERVSLRKIVSKIKEFTQTSKKTSKIKETKLSPVQLIEKKQKQPNIVYFGGKVLEEEKKEKPPMRFVKDKLAQAARTTRVVMVTTRLYAAKIFNTFNQYTPEEQYTMSGKELAGLIAIPTDDVVSGAAKKLGIKDNTLPAIEAQIAKMPETESFGKAVDYVNSVVNTYTPVDVRFGKEQTGEEQASTKEVLEVLVDALRK